MEIKQPKKRNLSRQRIIDAAFGILDENGLDGMSLRVLAEKLGVQAPAIYKHFRNKDDVLIGMTQVIIDTWSDECAKIKDKKWQLWITECGRALRRVLCEHRDGARLFVMYHSHIRTPLTHDIIAVLHTQGFAPNNVIPSAGTLVSFVIGFTIEEDFERRTEMTIDSPMAREIDPVFLEHAHDYDAQFEYGMACIVRGIAER